MKKIEITDGPSREELFDGLRLFTEKRLIPFRFKVSFELFRELAEENYLLGEFRKDLISVKAYYSTKTRRGGIEIE